jgi:hypothetical protein
MVPDPSIATSALKHGITRTQIKQVLDNVWWNWPDQGDLPLHISVGVCGGVDDLVEVGWQLNDSNERRVKHAMRCRPRYRKPPR